MAELEYDSKAMSKALKKTAPTRWHNPLLAMAIIGLCLTSLALIGNYSLYRWGSDKSNQVKALSASSECRSKLAADTDVAQGKFLADLGLVNLATARALAALGQSNDEGVSELVRQLIDNSNALDGTLAAYRKQTEARAKTAEICNTK